MNPAAYHLPTLAPTRHRNEHSQTSTTGETMKVSPSQRRSHTTGLPSGIEIEIPSDKNAFAILFLTLWMGGWTMGETTALRSLFGRGIPSGFSLFMLGWLVMWTIGGVWVVRTILWMAFGKEIVRVRHDELTIESKVFGLGKSREYDLAQVKRLRVAPDSTQPNARALRAMSSTGGLIAFDYGAKTVRFARSVDEAEAALIVEDIVSHSDSLQVEATTPP